MDRVSIPEFLQAATSHVMIDVRSPGEFADGHVPGAINLPLFGDEQRADVGTIFKQVGRHDAVLRGLELVGPNLKCLAERISALATSDQIFVHCWRGGMRSNSVAWLIETIGLRPVVLEGGYKSFRRAARACFAADREIVVLAGLTGSGKTEMLYRLRDAGEQIVDLEGLAHHRGSAFGGIGLPPQPTTEQFENRLYMELLRLDDRRRVWLEDESPGIGKVRVPDELWAQMRLAPALFAEVDRSQRVPFLVKEYGRMSPAALETSIQSISKRLGGLRTQEAIAAIRDGNVARAIEIVLDYYDKGYIMASQRKPRAHVQRIPLADPTTAEAVRLLMDAANALPENCNTSV